MGVLLARWLATGAATLLLGGCGQGERGAGAPNGDILANALVRSEAGEQAAAEASPAVANWFGRWNGPEGTFLAVARHPSGLPRVLLTLKDNLDGPGKPYLGHAEGRAISFSRGGERLNIRAGSGTETGFKWLAEKKDCLIVVPGKEGYCRD